MTTTTNWTDAIECLNAAREDIDGVPTVRIRSAYRDLNSKGSGPEEASMGPPLKAAENQAILDVAQ